MQRIKRNKLREEKRRSNKANKDFWERRIVRISVVLTIIISSITVSEKLFNWMSKLVGVEVLEVRIIGDVKDIDNRPIMDAFITIDNYDVQRRTTTEGKFILKLKAVPQGAWITLRVYHELYESYEEILEVKSDQLSFKITLKQRSKR